MLTELQGLASLPKEVSEQNAKSEGRGLGQIRLPREERVERVKEIMFYYVFFQCD